MKLTGTAVGCVSLSRWHASGGDGALPGAGLMRPLWLGAEWATTMAFRVGRRNGLQSRRPAHAPRIQEKSRVALAGAVCAP